MIYTTISSCIMLQLFYKKFKKTSRYYTLVRIQSWRRSTTWLSVMVPNYVPPRCRDCIQVKVPHLKGMVEASLFYWKDVVDWEFFFSIKFATWLNIGKSSKWKDCIRYDCGYDHSQLFAMTRQIPSTGTIPILLVMVLL